ncbi:MAG: acyloxyacyl hydrolase [Planctomycetes bacterium]|nr:acyloxyacyl hydrolase [Planctomycetota bacterium]
MRGPLHTDRVTSDRRRGLSSVASLPIALACLSALLCACAAAPRPSRAGAPPTLRTSSTPTTLDLDELVTAAPASPRAPRSPGRGAGRPEGDRLAVVHLQYGIPILQRAIFWDGNSEVDNFGGGLSNFWFLSDCFALRTTLNATWFRNEGNDRIAGEIEVGGRWYAYDFDTWTLFWDTTAGYQHGNNTVPPGGTEWNFTFSFGPGVDVPLDEHSAILGGVTFHHFSNALGRENDRNPSQNDARVWLGYGWTW